MSSTLQITGLEKQFKQRKVVQGVSLSVSSGEIVGLLGPNGAGKTTCFYMIVGLIQQDKGQITLGDIDISSFPMHKRAQHGIGYLPQEASIFRTLTVEQNILAILETRKNLNKQQRFERLNQLLTEFHITHIRNSKGQALSGGERRRVEIARALATDPSFILLDEPFAGVDPIAVNDIKLIINELKSRCIGVLITDHNVRETLDICEKAYIVSEGRVIAQGDAEEIMSNADVRKVYLGEQFKL
ncbi:MAG: LPS export ABC transporter ATP-binding protein [Pseudomonadales bacterium]|nr:LPS export ABC transporter ATP-binding protein [Pseudomonadales bacterium]